MVPESELGGAAVRGRRTRNPSADVVPITADHVEAVADFLRDNLNDLVPWHLACASAPWEATSPNHGFMLRDDHRVVGALLALYSERLVNGRLERFCNMGSWCVLPEYRSRSLSLLKALLAQDGYHFTVLTADVGPQEILAWSGFRYLDTSAALIPNLPWFAGPTGTRVSSDPDVIEGALAGRARTLYRDHATALAARHLVLTRGGQACYVMYRESRFKDKPVALVLHVSNRELFHRALRPLASHLLIRHRLVATLAELAIIERKPPLSFSITNWPKMYRSDSLSPGQVDYLYSELTCVPW
ncbi:hypothetical protein H7J06_22900 [Mycobacterium hodleri]|nr:hypothetical protein [Mycolicibacterium hodleri]